MQEVFEKIDAILQKYRKKWLEQPNTEPCKGLECISNDCVDCMLTHLENDINQVAEEYRTTMGQVKCDASFSDGYIKAIDDAIEKFLEYGCFCIEWNPKLSKERLVDDVLRQVKGQAVYNLEKMKQKEIDSVNQVEEEYNNGWISADVELPKKNGWYWGYYVTFSYIGTDGVKHTECKYASIYWEDNLWLYAPRSFRTVDEVIAWKPIAPYQPKGDNHGESNI